MRPRRPSCSHFCATGDKDRGRARGQARESRSWASAAATVIRNNLHRLAGGADGPRRDSGNTRHSQSAAAPISGRWSRSQWSPLRWWFHERHRPSQLNVDRTWMPFNTEILTCPDFGKRAWWFRDEQRSFGCLTELRVRPVHAT